MQLDDPPTHTHTIYTTDNRDGVNGRAYSVFTQCTGRGCGHAWRACLHTKSNNNNNSKIYARYINFSQSISIFFFCCSPSLIES